MEPYGLCMTDVMCVFEDNGKGVTTFTVVDYNDARKTIEKTMAALHVWF